MWLSMELLEGKKWKRPVLKSSFQLCYTFLISGEQLIVVSLSRAESFRFHLRSTVILRQQ